MIKQTLLTSLLLSSIGLSAVFGEFENLEFNAYFHHRARTIDFYKQQINTTEKSTLLELELANRKDLSETQKEMIQRIIKIFPELRENPFHPYLLIHYIVTGDFTQDLDVAKENIEEKIDKVVDATALFFVELPMQKDNNLEVFKQEWKKVLTNAIQEKIEESVEKEESSDANLPQGLVASEEVSDQKEGYEEAQFPSH